MPKWIALLLTILAGAAQAAPTLNVTTVPPWGSTQDIAGTVGGVAISSQTVACYVFTSGWWTKPTFSNPAVSVRPDGSWTADITTGGNDAQATKIAVYLLPGGVTPPRAVGAGSLPPELASLALASVLIDRPGSEKTLDFAGYGWRVKQAASPVGPGPNLFSDDPRDVWTDAAGMHFSIVRRDAKWWCTEVIMKDSLGYGLYYFTTRGRLDILPAWAVAGFFTWDDFAQPPHREIDFEYARWGDPNDPTNAQYVIQPYTTPGNRKRFRVDLGEAQQELTHALLWSPGRVWQRTWTGRVGVDNLEQTAPAAEWKYQGSGVPTPGRENWRVNLWISEPPPAATSGTLSMVMTDFKFVPLRAASRIWPEE